MALAGCSDGPREGIQSERLEGVQVFHHTPTGSMPDALLVGKPLVENGCLFIDVSDSEVSHRVVVVWSSLEHARDVVRSTLAGEDLEVRLGGRSSTAELSTSGVTLRCPSAQLLWLQNINDAR